MGEQPDSVLFYMFEDYLVSLLLPEDDPPSGAIAEDAPAEDAVADGALADETQAEETLEGESPTA